MPTENENRSGEERREIPQIDSTKTTGNESEQPQELGKLEKNEEKNKQEKIDAVREKIAELSEPDKNTLIERIRFAEKGELGPATTVSAQDREAIQGIAEKSKEHLRHNYLPGFGVMPSSEPDENFYNQVWTRDMAHASGNFFAGANPRAVNDSLETILKYQRDDGALPLRVEREYLLLKVFPGLRSLARPMFNLIEKGIKGRQERPVYEGQDFSGGEDTVPATIISTGEHFIASPDGREFVKEHYEQLKKAMDFFRSKTDPEDGLAVTKKNNADWADSIKRKGKLGNINVWWARSLRLMEYMASQLGHEQDAEGYKKEFRIVKNSVKEKLYHPDGYFRAAEGEDRLDTVASVFGALYLSSPDEATKIEENLEKRVRRSSGLQNFDPPYPKNQIFLPLRLIGHDKYHNEYVWPWVTLQNIQVKIKIALRHPDEAIRKQYQEEAVKDLADMANLFNDAGGVYEIFRPDDRKPAKTALYNPPENIMGNLAAYQSAYQQARRLGWIK